MPQTCLAAAGAQKQKRADPVRKGRPAQHCVASELAGKRGGGRPVNRWSSVVVGCVGRGGRWAGKVAGREEREEQRGRPL